MFKQFLHNYAGSQAYLIFSLWLFLAFFVIVSILLIKMRKSHVSYMSHLPLHEEQ